MRTMTKRPRSIDCDFKRTWEKSPMSIPSHRGFVLREKKKRTSAFAVYMRIAILPTALKSIIHSYIHATLRTKYEKEKAVKGIHLSRREDL